MKTLNELEHLSPQELEAAEAELMEADDAAAGKGAAPQGEADPDPATDPPATDPKPAAAAAATEPEPTTTPPATPAEPAAPKVTGVMSKDGKTVLPYAALKGARTEAQTERQRRQAVEAENARLQQELADAKAGKKTPDQQTDESLDVIVEEHPLLKPLVDEVKAARKARPAEPAPVATQEEPAGDDDVQEAIDSVPLLAQWQAEAAALGDKGHELFAAAIAHDNALKVSKQWRGKSLAERFAEAARRTARDNDIQFEDDEPAVAKTTAPSQPAKQDPAKVIEQAARTAPATLSDFKGGAPDNTRDALTDRTPPQQQVRAFDRMSDAEIDEHLARLG